VASPRTAHHFDMALRRRRVSPAADVDPDPLRTPEDATETGLLWGLLGRGPWAAITVKNMKDRRIATRGRANDEPGPKRAGTAAGKRAGDAPGAAE
jgi:hypothetical protein